MLIWVLEERIFGSDPTRPTFPRGWIDLIWLLWLDAIERLPAAEAWCIRHSESGRGKYHSIHDF
jgi:hypothetical protein